MSATTPAPQTPPAARTTAIANSRFWTSAIVGNLVFLLLLFAALVAISQTLAAGAQSLSRNLLQDAFITLAAAFPYLLYSFFIGARRPILERDFRLNLQRLGLNSEDESFTERLEAVFGAENKLNQFVRAPLVVVTALMLAFWLMVFYVPVPGAQTSAKFGALQINVNPLVTAFLGAYFVSLQTLIYRYLTNDLKPQIFVGVSSRLLIVTVVVLGLFVALPGTGDDAVTLAAAFIIGVFPQAGVRLLTQTANKLLTLLKFESFDERLPLGYLDGMNVLHELRLHDENVDNVENMATTDIVELFLQTRFPSERIIDWVDQALLQVHLAEPDRIEAYRGIGIRTASDLIDNFERAAQAGGSALADLRTRLAQADQGMGASGALESMVTALGRDPNVYSVRYWREHEYEILPRDANVHIMPGVVSLLRGQAAEAIRVYEDARRAEPRYPPISFYLGLAYAAAQRYDQAIETFGEAIRLNEPQDQPRPTSYYYYLSRGRAHRDQANLFAANAPSAEAAPDDAQALAQIQASVQDLDVATRLQPGILEGWMLLGEAQAEQPGRHADAAAALRRAIDLDPNRASPLTLAAFRHLAEVLAAYQQEYEQAAVVLDEPARSGRADAELLLLLGRLRAGLVDDPEGNQSAAAEQAFRFAQAIADRADLRPALGIAQVQLLRGRFDDAVAALQRLATEWPNNGEAALMLGRALMARAASAQATPEARDADLGASRMALARAAEIGPRAPAAALEYARALARLGQFAAAEEQLQRALTLRPSQPPGARLMRPAEVFSAAQAYTTGLTALVTLGLTREARGDWSGAQDAYLRATQEQLPAYGLSPVERADWNALMARAFVNLGKTYFERECKDAEAAQAFAQAAVLDPALVEAAEYVGLVILAQARALQLQGAASADQARARLAALLEYANEQLDRLGDRPMFRLLRGIAVLETTSDVAHAASDLTAARDGLAEASRRDWLAVAQFYLGRAQLGADDARGAVSALGDATLGVNFPRSPVPLYEVYLWLARAQLAAGAPDAARQAAEQARAFSASAPADVCAEIERLCAPAG